MGFSTSWYGRQFPLCPLLRELDWQRSKLAGPGPGRSSRGTEHNHAGRQGRAEAHVCAEPERWCLGLVPALLWEQDPSSCSFIAMRERLLHSRHCIRSRRRHSVLSELTV